VFFFRDTAYLFKTEMCVTFDIAVIVALSALTCYSQEGHQTSSSRAPLMIGIRFVEPDMQRSRVVRTLLLCISGSTNLIHIITVRRWRGSATGRALDL